MGHHGMLCHNLICRLVVVTVVVGSGSSVRQLPRLKFTQPINGGNIENSMQGISILLQHHRLLLIMQKQNFTLLMFSIFFIYISFKRKIVHTLFVT